jgi:hypothetical protein
MKMTAEVYLEEQMLLSKRYVYRRYALTLSVVGEALKCTSEEATAGQAERQNFAVDAKDKIDGTDNSDDRDNIVDRNNIDDRNNVDDKDNMDYRDTDNSETR